MALALAVGAASGLPWLVLGTSWAFALWAVGGGLAAWLVASKRRGIVGLLAGAAAAFAAWGGQEILEQVERCGDSCSGLSSPTFTALIVVGFGLLALLVAAGGYAAGRGLHWLLIGRAARSGEHSAG